MTKQEFRLTLARLGWTQKRAADELGVSLRTINRYAAVEGTIPRTVELALQRLTWFRQA